MDSTNASETALWRLFFVSRTQEQDLDVRSILADILHTGLRQCGAIGLVGSLLYVGLSVLGLGYGVHWPYRAVQSAGLDHQVVVVGTLIVAALSVAGLVLAQMECSLRAGRLFGLGLAIVDRLVTEMNSSIEVNTEKGVGTCFTVRLPRDAGAADESGE